MTIAERAGFVRISINKTGSPGKVEPVLSEPAFQTVLIDCVRLSCLLDGFQSYYPVIIELRPPSVVYVFLGLFMETRSHQGIKTALGHPYEG